LGWTVNKKWLRKAQFFGTIEAAARWQKWPKYGQTGRIATLLEVITFLK
jgi:hypothetical protein